MQRVLDYAKEAGLYVVARAGPYCNAETNGGGLALWGSDGSLGNLRTSDATYHAAWQPFVAKIGAILAANEITKGGVCQSCSFRQLCITALLIVFAAGHLEPSRK